jgi:hypothetical protein
MGKEGGRKCICAAKVAFAQKEQQGKSKGKNTTGRQGAEADF